MQISETEEREYMCGVFYDLSLLVSVDISFKLNVVLYGFFLSLISKIFSRKNKNRSGEIVAENNEVIEAKCTSCNSSFHLYGWGIKAENNSNYGEIVECKSCGSFTLIFIEGNEHDEFYSSSDYYPIEKLPKYYTEKDAKERLEQIRYWRK